MLRQTQVLLRGGRKRGGAVQRADTRAGRLPAQRGGGRGAVDHTRRAQHDCRLRPLPRGPGATRSAVAVRRLAPGLPFPL